jgi:hypothetical protein
MEQLLAEMFDQARKLVADADRKLAEEEERRQEKEREAILLELAGRVEASFDFTSKEKLELDPRLDFQNSKPLIEFVVRSLRAIFVLAPQLEGQWNLSVMEDGREPQDLGDFKGGSKADSGSRRLAAARIVTAIGNWSQKIQSVPKKAAQSSQQPRWQDQMPAPLHERKEPTYGTFGKFLGY